jgi:hypothetical protein
VELFHVIITKEDSKDPYSMDRVKVYVAKKEGVSKTELKQEITKNMKAQIEISPSEVIFENYDKLTHRLFDKTGVKAEWVVDERSLPTGDA